MVRITVDEMLRSKLHGFRLRAELCDAAGRVLGYFIPAADPNDYEGVRSPTTDEELDRRSRAGGGRPLAEILRELEKQG